MSGPGTPPSTPGEGQPKQTGDEIVSKPNDQHGGGNLTPFELTKGGEVPAPGVNKTPAGGKRRSSKSKKSTKRKGKKSSKHVGRKQSKSKRSKKHRKSKVGGNVHQQQQQQQHQQQQE